MNDRVLIAVVNALERYKIRLESSEIDQDGRSALEHLMGFTLNVAVDYKIPVRPWITWYTKYMISRAAGECRADKGLPPTPIFPVENEEMRWEL